MDVSAKELEDRCDEIFLRFEAMLSAADVTSPSACLSPRTGVVTEQHSPSATAHSRLPSPVNQFLHDVSTHTDDATQNITWETCPPLAPSVQLDRDGIPASKKDDTGKENHPVNESIPEQPQDAEEIHHVEHASSRTCSAAQATSADLSRKQHRIRELQQQLEIAKRVTDEQYSMSDLLFPYARLFCVEQVWP